MKFERNFLLIDTYPTSMKAEYVRFPCLRTYCILLHTGGGGRGRGRGKWWMKQHPPDKFSKKLVNKNAIKAKIGDTPGNFSGKPRAPSKNLSYRLPWIFNPCVSMNISIRSTSFLGNGYH